MREQNINKLDFPKGKADEEEPDVECAIREIGEEIGLNIRPYLDENQFIKMETIRNKVVTLYIVKDLDEATTKFKLKGTAEVQKIEWIDTKFYLQQTLVSGIEEQKYFNWLYV